MGGRIRAVHVGIIGLLEGFRREEKMEMHGQRSHESELAMHLPDYPQWKFIWKFICKPECSIQMRVTAIFKAANKNG